jgi:Nuclear pore complex scaffold, nucleoporins 186/192/205
MVVGETNELFRGGLGTNLMKSVADGLGHMKNSEEYKSSDKCIRKISECLFFMYYGTQIEESEVRSLTNLIKTVSDVLVDTNTPEIVEEWKTSAFATLAILQMTHISALDQFNSLLQRTSDDVNTSEDDMNALKQIPGSKEGMDMTWRSRGAKGLACLANAVLRQPAVDSNEAPAADVVWFLKEASDMRAYSYIRLCLLPLLQCSCLKDDEHFYISVLCELLRKIAHIFHIYELARHPDRPYFLRSYDLALARSGTEGSPLIRSDCLDDVMHLFAMVCSVRPSFAEAFRDVDATGASTLHPFVVTALEASDRQPCLVLPAMRLLTGVGSGLRGVTAGASYHFLKGAKHPRLKWDHLFFCVESFAKQLGAAVQAPSGISSVPSSSVSSGPVRGSPLNPKDEEGLLAIIELIGSCVQEASIADNLYHKYDPVKKLFSLLACPISTTLKGAIFRALAAFSRSSSTVAEEVWELIEQYRLLPARGQGGGQQGLRFELEATESRAGVYPSTEGFLQLLDALLCTYNTPDNLGMGYRRPGLMMYLEFALDDVLLRAHERFYAPEGTHRGMTQRWRLTARALKVLVSIMQHYAINRLPVGSLSSLPMAVKDDPILQGVAADFREEVVLYKVDDLPEQRCSRPKTLGFSLMALMLGRCRLLERVLSLLGECSLSALDAERDLQGAETAKASVEIVATMQSPSKVQSGVSAYGNVLSEETIDLEMDLSMLGFNDDSFACDGSYWMEKTVSNCIGLLYECSLRESRFLELMRAAPPLTLLRSEDGRTTTLPVMIQGGLVEALSSSLALGTVAHFMRIPAVRWHSIPSVPVMATRLLEHVAITKPPERLLIAMKSTEEETSFLLSGCVRAIIEGDGSETSAVFKEIFPLGADRYPDVFTQSVAQSGTPPDIAEALKLNGAESAREALLRLMLKALVLTPGRLCLTHQLLGIRDMIVDGGNGINLPALSRLGRNAKGYLPVNCLQAILILITPSDKEYSTDRTVSIIQREPELACTCYEIIYHLCASPLSSAITLGYLRSQSVQFLNTQMQELLSLACLPDNLLRSTNGEGADTTTNRYLYRDISYTSTVLTMFFLCVYAKRSSPSNSICPRTALYRTVV